jgi:probable O-glycosylation ligase (exosortase A-associated)
MRDYLIVGIVLLSLPIGLLMPFYGLLVYAWISYMNPHMYAWSFAQSFPVAKLSALSALAGTLFTQARDLAPLRQRETIAMLLLWCASIISSIFALYPSSAWVRWQDTTKVTFMALLAAVLLTDRRRIRYFLLLIALSLGFYGFKGGLFSLTTGGKYMVNGPGESIIGANNAIGLALNMCLPLLWYLAQEEKGWLRRLLQVTFYLSIPAILFTYSRASALTLPLILLFLRGKGRIFLVSVLLMAAVLAVPYIPEVWRNRQMTVLTYEQDGSAMSRIDNWKLSWRIVLDDPLTGAGFGFQNRETFLKYSPEFFSRYGVRLWDTHSIYFSILACHGFPGFAMFVAMFFFTIASCRRMARQVRDRPDLRWVRSYCNIVAVSLLAFLINGIFVNMEYFDLPYHWVAVVASMKVICNKALNAPETEQPDLATA